MKTYITSDTHFNHKNIIEYENRPFKDLEDMKLKIIKNWNNLVSKNDIVYHLGDFGFGSEEEIKDIVSKLNGRIFLVSGNHDSKNYQRLLRCGFEKVYDKPIIIDDYYILSHKPLYLNANMPYANLYGHVHGNSTFKTISNQSACICVERWDYKPVLLDSIKKLIEEKNIKENNAIEKDLNNLYKYSNDIALKYKNASEDEQKKLSPYLHILKNSSKLIELLKINSKNIVDLNFENVMKTEGVNEMAKTIINLKDSLMCLNDYFKLDF